MKLNINSNPINNNLNNKHSKTPPHNSKNISQRVSFSGPLDGLITQSLVTIDTNPMVNAALVDIFAMVIPRTYVDTKERNKYAGAETLFRELTGTFIVCLSSGYLAKGIAHLYNKFVNPETKINPDSWVSNDSLKLLSHSWNKSEKTTEKYVSNVLSNLSGNDGKGISEWQKIDWKNTQWYEDKKWQNLDWSNSKFKNIQENLKDENSIIKTLTGLIEENHGEKDTKQVLQILEHRIANALKTSSSINVHLDDKTLASSLHNLLRDTYDLGKNVFVNKNINTESAITKLTKMNKVKTLGALSIASVLGLTNQYINRLITKKRTGTDAFVGDLDYKSKINKKETKKEHKGGLFGLKLLTSAGIIALAAVVMKIRSPKDFIKKLEFTSAITSGNAIKTVYTATLVGRFLAAKNKTELRETATRDYLGFLNWLVFGGFAAKGVANLLDKNKNNLFNIQNVEKEVEGKGLKHWLNDISLKSHAEIASKGKEFAKKNIWKLNLAHASGLVYSTVALGILLPMLNIAVTKNKQKKEENIS